MIFLDSDDYVSFVDDKILLYMSYDKIDSLAVRPVAQYKSAGRNKQLS